MRVAVAMLAVTLAGSSTANAGRGTALTKYLPDDVSMALVADVSHFRSSKLIEQADEVLRHHSARWKALADAGVPLADDVDTFYVAATGTSTSAREVYTIIDGKVSVLLDKLKTDQVRKHAGITYYKLADAELAIVDKHLIIAPEGGMDAVIDRARGKGASAAASERAQTFRTAMTAPSGVDLWGATVIDEPTKTSASSQISVQLEWVGFAMAIATNATLNLRFGCSDVDSATAMATWISGKLDDASFRDGIAKLFGDGFVTNVSIDRDGTTVRASGTLSSDDVAQLARGVNTWF